MTTIFNGREFVSGPKTPKGIRSLQARQQGGLITRRNARRDRRTARAI